uniref:Uncharacterized protein n=1 Tax=Fagus sylvatica TaxID=28930 RepID=A0A2N9J137_FAGSY
MAGPGSLTGYSMVVDLEFLQVEHQEVDALESVEYFFANLDIDYDNSISAFVEEDLAQCASKNVVEKLMNERSFVLGQNSISAFVEKDSAQCASKSAVKKLMNETSFVMSNIDQHLGQLIESSLHLARHRRLFGRLQTGANSNQPFWSCKSSIDRLKCQQSTDLPEPSKIMIYRKTTPFHVARPIKHVAQGQSTDLPEPSKIMIYRKTTPFHVARPIKHVAQGGLEDEQVERVCYPPSLSHKLPPPPTSLPHTSCRTHSTAPTPQPSLHSVLDCPKFLCSVLLSGAGRGYAVRERGGVSCPDHRGGAGSGIDSTSAVRGRVTHDLVPIRPVAIPIYYLRLNLVKVSRT